MQFVPPRPVRSLCGLSLALFLLGACIPGTPLTSEELLDPVACADCHAEHYEQWSGSMHAYAADDPVFVAMNERGQRETGGELGSFCVECHAPMAVRTGATEDGLNLAELDPKLRGVTCAFCHRIDSIEDDHNARMTLGPEATMRGGIADPVRTRAHASVYSPLHDRHQRDSAALCGSCHDVVTPAGVHLERTFVEWQESVFGHEGVSQLTCGNCHMRGFDGPAFDDPSAPIRRVHDHDMPGVDIALDAFPERDEQLEAVQGALDTTLLAELCVVPDQGLFRIDVTLENVNAGHGWPSGATQDRRAWVELIATAGDNVLLSSGEVLDGEPITELVDPNLWLMRDRMTNADGEEVHMFWEAAATEGEQLPASVTNDPTDPLFVHWVRKSYAVVGPAPDRVTMRVRIRPMGFEVLQSLVDSDDLDPGVLDAMPTFDLASTVLEWNGELGTCVP
ncbi:MAG: cytochrome c family protein [Myxococcota bacterium]|nr:cytochrome c family protein [Myxococcota bacterium]